MEFNLALQQVIESITSGLDKKTVESNQEQYYKIQKLYKEQPTQFLDFIQLAQQDFVTLSENAMDIPDSDESYIVEHIITGLYKHFHTQRAENLEGSAFSYDKSTFIEVMTLRAIKNQQNLSLFADYTNVEQIKKDKEKQAYWSPKTIKDTDEAIQLFWKWYQVN